MFKSWSVPTIALACLVLAGCGSWPPIVEASRDVLSLPADQASIRARGLRDRDINSLARLHQLRILDFAGGYGVKEASLSDEGLRQLARLDLPLLETLTLGHCQGITDQGLVHLGTMQTISYLSLAACSGISDCGLPSLTSARNLTGLDLRGCPGITDEGIMQLATKTNWASISLGGCPNVTDAGVAMLQSALPNAWVEKNDEEWAMHSH